MTPKKIFLLNVAIVALALGIWLLSKWGEMDVISRFATFLLLTAGVAVFAAIFVLPAIGEWVGNLFYSAPEEVEPDKYTQAASRLAQGDYKGAIKSYQSIAKDEPDSRFPIVEIAKIQLEQLGDVESSIATVQTALGSRQWAENDAAFFMFKLADLHYTNKGDDETATSYLQRVIDTFPDTRHSANAHHKLNEIAQASQRH